ncbi:MAG: hypothetical protein E3J35_00020 [Methanomassiliicoccales archaeon]|nr:MAG: hypothetical protein E3J35_00020 [Methanomassiliicoccales archaeon]
MGIGEQLLTELKPEHIGDLEEFLRKSTLKGMSKVTVRTYIYQAMELLKYVKKPFCEISKREIEDWLLTKSEPSRETALIQIRGVFRLANGGVVPDSIRGIEIGASRRATPVDSFDNLLTQDDLKKMAESSPNPRVLTYSPAGGRMPT